MFYALLCDFLLISGSNENLRQRGIQEKKNEAKRQKDIFSHTKTNELLWPLVAAIMGRSSNNPRRPHLMIPNNNVIGLLREHVEATTGHSRETRESCHNCFVSLIRLIFFYCGSEAIFDLSQI